MKITLSVLRLNTERNKGILIFLCFLLFSSCKKDQTEFDSIAEGNKVITLTIPRGLLYPEIPVDNLPTKNRIELGKMLFFDPILSRDSTVSCSSCHQTDKFLTDNLKVSIGIEGRTGIRNSPSLINVAYQPSMFWDGGNPTLEQQVLGPIDNHNEFDFDVNAIVQKLKLHPIYPKLFQQAYNQAPSVFSLTRAIACFERTLIEANSRYDDYTQQSNLNALTESEIRGLNLFFSEEGECFHCHQGALFTDFSFRNNGLYVQYADSGRARITQNLSDIGKFKVPSLRNVEMTAPYMHDGSISTLEAVIEHYSSGGKSHPNKSPIIQPLNLTSQQKEDLINFLKSLTNQ
jgi:cytochrome c peroxidase